MPEFDLRRLHVVGRTWPSSIAVPVRRALAAPTPLAQLGWAVGAIEAFASTLRILLDADLVGFDGELLPDARRAMAGQTGQELSDLTQAARVLEPRPRDTTTADALPLLQELGRLTLLLPEISGLVLAAIEPGPPGVTRLRLLRGLVLPSIWLPESPELPHGAALVLASGRDDALLLGNAGAFLSRPLRAPASALEARAVAFPSSAWEPVARRLWPMGRERRVSAVLLECGSDRYLDESSGEEWIRRTEPTEAHARLIAGEPWVSAGPAGLRVTDRFHEDEVHDPHTAAPMALALLRSLAGRDFVPDDFAQHAEMTADSVALPALPGPASRLARSVSRTFLGWALGQVPDVPHPNPAVETCRRGVDEDLPPGDLEAALTQLATERVDRTPGESPPWRLAEASVWEQIAALREASSGPLSQRVGRAPLIGAWTAVAAIERRWHAVLWGGVVHQNEESDRPAISHAALDERVRAVADPAVTERFLQWEMAAHEEVAEPLAKLYLGALDSPLRAQEVIESHPEGISASLRGEVSRLLGGSESGPPSGIAAAREALGRGAPDEAMLAIESAIAAEEGSAVGPLLLELARIRFEEMGDAPGARQVLAGLLELDAGDLDALRLLERIADGLSESSLRDECRRRRSVRAVGAARRNLAPPPPTVEAEANTQFVTSPVQAGRALIRESRLPEALAHFEALTRALERFEAADPVLELAIWTSLGEVREGLQDDVRAAGAYERALSIDNLSASALAGLARIAEREGDVATAESHYRTLSRGATQQGDAESAARYDALREALPKPAEPAPLAADPTETAARAAEALGDVAKAEALWRARLAEVEDRLERFHALLELAELLRRQFGPSDGVVDLLAEAHQVRPDSKAVVVRLIELERVLGHPARAARWLEALAALETAPERRGRVLSALAQLTRELGRHGDARTFAERALELHADLEAFDILRGCLELAGDSASELQLLEQWLPRLVGTEREPKLLNRRYTLLAAEGGTGGRSREALAAAVNADPNNLDLLEALARLEEAEDPSGEKPLPLYRRVLVAGPRRVSAYRGIGRVVARRRDRDAAWCVATVVSHLGAAGIAERDFVDKHRRGLLAVKRPLAGASAWDQFLVAESQDVVLTKLFELVGRSLGGLAFPWTLGQAGLGPADRVPMRDGGRFPDLLRTVSKILDVPLPSVYRKAVVPTLCKVPMSPPVLLVHPDLEFTHKGKALRFLLGKALAFFLPGHLLAGVGSAASLPGAPADLASSAMLKTLLLGTISAGADEPATISDGGVLEVREALLARMRKQEIEDLRGLVTTLEERGSSPNVSEWLYAVELTANRAGLLLSNDLDVAVRTLEEERTNGIGWSKLPLELAVDDLLRYVVSDRYFALRRALGAAIEE